MALKVFVVLLVLTTVVTGQNYKICIPSNYRTLCNSLELNGSQATCQLVESRIDCALKLSRGEAHFGVFNEEETQLLGQELPNDNRVVATIRDVSRTEPYAFEAVAVVPSTHSGGLEGLRGGGFCHPGFDAQDQRWSPRVLKAFEYAVTGSDRCINPPSGRTVEELEAATLSEFFSAACRPGPWTPNAFLDNRTKFENIRLCSLCGPNPSCDGYFINMGNPVARADINNRHIQVLECLRTNSPNTVAYVAWQHVREFFTYLNPEATSNFAVLCPDGSTQQLTTNLLSSATAPCAFVRQPWPTVVATAANAAAVQASLRSWYPNGVNPGGSTWQATLFNGVIGGANARLVFEDDLPTPAAYSSAIRQTPAIDADSTCLPTRRWCTISADEQKKCNWVRSAAHILGLKPTISCQQRDNIFGCMEDIAADRADFIASASNYGYLARQHYSLSPVKLVQNSRSVTNAFSRVAAFVKESSSQTSLSSFESLRGKKACFPEFGGIAYVAFVRTGQERGVLSDSECDYARAVGDFFDSACAPGAEDASHALSQSNYNATSLCAMCRSSVSNSAFTCTWDYTTNLYFGNNGSLACLADPNTDVAFLQIQNINSYLAQLNLQPSQFRALCRNNSLAVNTGVNVDDNCLLAHVLDAEVITRRNDPNNNALSILLEYLEFQFGYIAESKSQLINLEIFSPFDGISDLLFKDSAIGLTDPTVTSENQAARNYIQLFNHLETCTSAAFPTTTTTTTPTPGDTGAAGFSTRNVYSVVMMFVSVFVNRLAVY